MSRSTPPPHRSRRRVSLTTALLFAAMLLTGSVVLAACGAKANTAQPFGSNVVITIRSFAYHPSTLQVKTGTKVTVINRDHVP